MPGAVPTPTIQYSDSPSSSSSLTYSQRASSPPPSSGTSSTSSSSSSTPRSSRKEYSSSAGSGKSSPPGAKEIRWSVPAPSSFHTSSPSWSSSGAADHPAGTPTVKRPSGSRAVSLIGSLSLLKWIGRAK